MLPKGYKMFDLRVRGELFDDETGKSQLKNQKNLLRCCWRS